MVSILPSARTPFDVIGADVGQALQSVLPQAVQQMYNRKNLQQSLNQIKQIAADPNSSPLDILLSTMQAGAGIPGSERYLATLAPELVKFAEARRAQGVRQPGEESIPAIPQRQELPGFMGKEQPSAEFFPTNLGSQGAPGNIPQPATTGQIIPLLTPSEKRSEAKRLSKESTSAGIPLTPVQALEEVNKAEDDKRLHNQTVESERKQRVGAQQTYGKRASDELLKVYPEATSEQQAIFQKIGEEEAAKGKSEAEINRFLSKAATNFKNSIVNVEKDLSAPRLQNMIQRAATGTYKNLEQAGEDVRSHLKPILDLGLYDTARKILSNKGYGPEEREVIINPLSERSKITLNKVPDVRAKKELGKIPGQPVLAISFKKPEINIDNIKDGLSDLKKSDPNFSLVLARKAFEDKGYDWRIFKDALNDLERQGFELTDDQNIQKGYLDTPPLNKLEEILHGLNIIGR